jgi:hypothetical protein
VSIRVPFRSATLLSSTGTSNLLLTDGTLTIDDGWAPGIQARIVIARPSLAVQARLDPTDPKTRVRLILRSEATRQYRTIELKLTARQIDAGTGTIGLNLQSDEALLQDFALVASGPDRTFWSYQDNVLSIAYNVLNRALGPGNFSLALPVGTPNTSLPTYSSAENLIPNGSFENASSTPWAAGNAVVTASTGYKASGAYSLLVNPNSTSNDSFAETPIRVTSGKTYTASATLAALGQTGGLNARARRVWVYGLADGQVVVLGQSNQPAANAVGVRASVTFTVPPNVDTAIVRLYCGAPSGTSQAVYWDNVVMFEGDGLDTNGVSIIPFFDGATLDTATRTPPAPPAHP